MKTLITFLLLISTPLMAQQDRTGRLCPKDPYAVGRPTVEELQRRVTTKTVPAVEQQTCRTIEAVRVASEAIETSDVEKVVNVLDAFSRRLEALENHVTAEEKRIYSNINRVDSKVSEMGSRISTPVDATPYVPPQKAVSAKSNRFESKSP